MNNKEYEKFEKIGEGKCANIYKSGNNVYKILKENTDSKKFYSKEMLQQLAEIKRALHFSLFNRVNFGNLDFFW